MKSGDFGMLSRRGFFAGGIAVTAAHLLAGQSQTAVGSPNQVCALTSEETIGPYYLNLESFRQDITEGKAGLPLKLRLTVLDATRCLPIENAALDIWHCDASGIYSGFTANSPDGPPGGMPLPPFRFANRTTDNSTFLRGVQLTNKGGVVEFTTIYPGWYAGRDIHIHLRVHLGGSASSSKYIGGHVCHTGQLYFPDEVTDEVAKLDPYAQRHTRRTRQPEDDVFTTQHGSEAIVSLSQIDAKSMSAGPIASAVIAVDPAASRRPDMPMR